MLHKIGLSLLLLTSAFFCHARDRVTVFAASSMTEALTSIANQYQQQMGTKVSLVFAASSSLARQISQGAPADIFISANQRWMAAVADAGYSKEQDTWLSNSLVLVAPNQAASAEQTLAELRLHPGQYLALGDPSHVPLGIYSKQALVAANRWQSLQGQLAFTRNARAALALVEREQADFAILYYSDALASSKVKIVQHILPSTHAPIYYFKARLTDQQAAADFYRYLKGDKAQQILLKYGFTL